MGVFAEGAGTITGARNAKKARQAARADKEERMRLLNSLDYTPMYASETTPTYQRTQSPVARSYLESFLSGSNPDATFSGAPNAGYQKAQAQLAQNRQYGTPDERIAAQQQINTATPWQVSTPTRSVQGTQQKALDQATYNKALGAGYTMDDLRHLQSAAPEHFKAGRDLNFWQAITGPDYLKEAGYQAPKISLRR